MPDWVTNDDWIKERLMKTEHVLVENANVTLKLSFSSTGDALDYVSKHLAGVAAAPVAAGAAAAAGLAGTAAKVTPIATAKAATAKVTEAPAKKAAPAKAAPAPAPEAAPDVDDDFGDPTESVDVPKEVLAAANFREVMAHFLDQDPQVTDPAVIEQHCRAWAPRVPAISKLGDKLPERIARALTVLVGAPA